MARVLERIFGSYSDREIRRLMPVVEQINGLKDTYGAMNDNELRGMTDKFRQRLEDGETLDDILPDAFAVVREAATRTLKQTHFDVQLLGGIVLHQGRIAEMKTGEGKTLVATLPAYLNALEGKGVHIVTVNDYLAKRDSEWMGQIYKFLGLSVGCIIHDLTPADRKAAYNCDITYGTNNEFGFDYLRDNMVVFKEEMVQRPLNFAIVDEVDSILIDEARTPLIISGVGDKSTDMYKVADAFVLTLKPEDYEVDEKTQSVALNDSGIKKAERFFNLENYADADNMEIQHHVMQALKAHFTMKRDIDYVVKDGEVIIVDEFTGRLMFGRRYSDGLHQAIEAKEHVKVERESKTLATITFQNYFRMYRKLSGMTGTALTEEEEFRTIYNLDVIAVPTNKPMIRVDKPDLVYKTERGKFNAVIDDIVETHKTGQPVLVGTISIEKSELISGILKRKSIPHQVLNAKYHEKEAEIISHAGEKGTVTIATNMAGRGTDIKLGEGVTELGGLKIIGTERHESRRIDNQLRGRSGRQGDPGESRFYISLEDDLMRLFGSDKVKNLVDRLGLEEDQPIENKMLTNAIENAQKKVEGNNLDIRRSLLQYDNVLNQQREVIYSQRRLVLEGADLKEQILSMIREVINSIVDAHTGGGKDYEDYDLKGLLRYCHEIFLPNGIFTEDDIKGISRESIQQKLYDEAATLYQQREEEFTPDRMREIERVVMLRSVDTKWMDHIDAMEELKQGIGLRAFRQRDPVQEYQFEGSAMFDEMIYHIKEDTVKLLFHVRIEKAPEREQVAEPIATNQDDSVKKKPIVKPKKIGRNDPCPCGSGKKYKNCCGRNA